MRRRDKGFIVTAFLMTMIFLSIVSTAIYYMSDHNIPTTRSSAEKVEQANSAVQKDIQESKKREKAESTQIILPETQTTIDYGVEQPKNEATASKNIAKKHEFATCCTCDECEWEKFKIENDQTSNADVRQPYLSRNFKEVKNTNQYQEGITEDFKECERSHKVVYHSRQNGGYIACFDCKKFEEFTNIGTYEMYQKAKKDEETKAAAEGTAEYEECPVCGEYQASPAHMQLHLN